MADKKFEPTEYASPACYAHELMPAFQTDINTQKSTPNDNAKTKEKTQIADIQKA